MMYITLELPSRTWAKSGLVSPRWRYLHQMNWWKESTGDKKKIRVSIEYGRTFQILFGEYYYSSYRYRLTFLWLRFVRHRKISYRTLYEGSKSKKQQNFLILIMDSMVFLVGLGKLIKRIWKKKKYRWLSYAICIITFSTLYDYIHSIITHTIICFPMWIWGIIPVVTILIFFAKFGIKKKSIFLQVVLGCCFGIVVTGVLGVLFYTTNYWFASSHMYHLDAYVVGKRYIQRHGGYRSWGLSKYYMNLKFIDNQETFRLDDSKVFKKINQGDSVCVNFVKGLYGINIIKDISPKNK